MLSRANRLKKQVIPEILASGRSVASGPISLKYLAVKAQNGPTPPSQFTFVVSGKQVRTAVKRNLLKRRARHALRRHLAAIKPGYRGMFFLRAPLLTIPFDQLEQQIVFLLKQTRII